MQQSEPISATIVLNDMGGTNLAVYGFRSWLMQDYAGKYEIVFNLFNDKRPVFEKLRDIQPAGCEVVFKEHPKPPMFNISAANNLGLHYSRGKWVIFCNADVIMPSYYLRRLMQELERGNWHYVLGGRWNLTAGITSKIEAVEKYKLGHDFDWLLNEVADSIVSWGPLMSPWVIRRDTAMKVGGFDCRIFCHEDMDLSDRTHHYLKRMGLQDVVLMLSSYDMQGYHMYHQPGRLHVMSKESFRVMGPRRIRLWADPSSEEDCVATPLHSAEELLKIMNTPIEQLNAEVVEEDTKATKVVRRLKNAWSVLRYGNFT